MNTFEQNIKLESNLNELHKVEAFVEQVCDENMIYNNYYSNILVTVTEAFTNAVIHGNCNNPNKIVVVGCNKNAQGLVFYIEDQGEGFNSMTITDPTDVAHDANKGRGLFLIKHLTDEFYFSENGSKIELLFKISSINYENALTRVNLLKEYYSSVLVKTT